MGLKWKSNGKYGGQADEYRIAAFNVSKKDQEPEILWSLYFGWELLGFYKTKEQAKAEAEKHGAAVSRENLPTV